MLLGGDCLRREIVCRSGSRSCSETPGEAASFPRSHLPPALERAPERDLVGVLEVAADGQPAGEAGHARRGRAAGRRCRRRSPRRSCSGWWRSRPPRSRPSLDPAQQLLDAQVARLDAVERRERAAEHVVEAAELVRALERDRRPPAARRRRSGAGRGAASRQIEQSSSSVRLPHSRQKWTRSFTSTIASASASASSFGTCSRWKASRCAVRCPMLGSRVSCATRFSIAGESTG